MVRNECLLKNVVLISRQTVPYLQQHFTTMISQQFLNHFSLRYYFTTPWMLFTDINIKISKISQLLFGCKNKNKFISVSSYQVHLLFLQISPFVSRPISYLFCRHIYTLSCIKYSVFILTFLCNRLGLFFDLLENSSATTYLRKSIS